MPTTEKNTLTLPDVKLPKISALQLTAAKATAEHSIDVDAPATSTVSLPANVQETSKIDAASLAPTETPAAAESTDVAVLPDPKGKGKERQRTKRAAYMGLHKRVGSPKLNFVKVEVEDQVDVKLDQVDVKPIKVKTPKTTPSTSGRSNFVVASDWDIENPQVLTLKEVNPRNRFPWIVYIRIHELTGPSRWSNAKGSGLILTLIVRDKDGDGMRVLTFDESAINGVMENAVVGSIMSISNVKTQAVTKFQRDDILNVEMVISGSDNVEFPLQDHGIPPISYPLTEIHLLRGMADKTPVNVMGVILSVGNLQSISAIKRVAEQSTSTSPDDDGDETGERIRREVHLTSTKKFVVRLTLWGDNATTFSGQPGQVLLLRNVIVRRYGGTSLNYYALRTSMRLEPRNTDGVEQLKAFFKTVNKDTTFEHISSGYSAGAGQVSNVTPRSETLTVAEVLTSGLGRGGRVDTFTIVARISVVDQDCLYEACFRETCNKSIEKEPCKTKGHQVRSTDVDPHYCYNLKLMLGDKPTESICVNVFSPLADELMNVSATKLATYRTSFQAKFLETLGRLLKTTWKFTVQVRTTRWKGANDNEYHEGLNYHVTAAEYMHGPNNTKVEDVEEIDEIEDADEIQLMAGCCAGSALIRQSGDVRNRHAVSDKLDHPARSSFWSRSRGRLSCAWLRLAPSAAVGGVTQVNLKCTSPKSSHGPIILPLSALIVHEGGKRSTVAPQDLHPVRELARPHATAVKTLKLAEEKEKLPPSREEALVKEVRQVAVPPEPDEDSSVESWFPALDQFQRGEPPLES
ncbi:hypothetical protein CALCODRAFT_520839 [Calocera cornea HHB12733]|uniref:Replication protein A OB domain-containing protein n=1 Tax=Calocera cornea HHB12733 TaxID=1353952 RepID=A0A165D7G1_9BASI|nr:hypothetical protein CALCODRAFT_520839 [Calocera cornea HHB12733]